jgi:hypothetical protein
LLLLFLFVCLWRTDGLTRSQARSELCYIHMGFRRLQSKWLLQPNNTLTNSTKFDHNLNDSDSTALPGR